MTSRSTRTFIDSSVLIAAWRGKLNLRIKALTILSDPQREFISSPFVRLEVRPKAVFHKNQTEVAFYDVFFTSVTAWFVEYKKLRSSSMLREHERVVLTTSVPTEGLEAGDVGTVVHVYKDGEAYEVEFLTLDGRTAAVATLEASQVRPVGRHDITHTRELSVA